MVDVSDSLFIFCFLVSDSHNFVPERQRPHDYGFRAYGELSRFVYCLLQKVKDSESLPLIEKWETYMLPNHSSFTSVPLENFLVGSRFLEYVSKLPSPSLRSSFKQDCFTFFEDLISQILVNNCSSFTNRTRDECFLSRDSRGRRQLLCVSVVWGACGFSGAQ